MFYVGILVFLTTRVEKETEPWENFTSVMDGLPLEK